MFFVQCTIKINKITVKHKTKCTLSNYKKITSWQIVINNSLLIGVTWI